MTFDELVREGQMPVGSHQWQGQHLNAPIEPQFVNQRQADLPFDHIAIQAAAGYQSQGFFSRMAGL